ncbi:amidohydrolase [Pseudomaricurvus alkylphenolicus]|uniref:amidohydrolase n=1 Tax=Pseudomaricurvus alkylphenolicus TaxID=1306991 RepID=UPI001422790C|nr:amidohydrolase [Pseudomaricurvus alkylphenolicus]NIB43386.1 amidohydrolase [Pseudomaricurvus alkylphenolicus]
MSLFPSRALLVAIGLMLSLTGCMVPERNFNAATVFVGGRIYTADAEAREAQAVAVRDGTIVYVGYEQGIAPWLPQAKEIVPLQGATLLPGLIDGHTHPGILSLFASTDLIAAPDPQPDKLLAWLKDYAEHNPAVPFIIAGFWRTGDFGIGGPHKDMIDQYISDRPVALMDDSGHSMWLNSKALELIGVDESTPDPAPGLAFFARDEHNNPTGWVKEFASAPVQEHILKPRNPALFERNLEKFLGYLSSQGVTALYDGGNLWLHDSVYPVLAKLDQEGRLPLHYEGTVHVHLPEQIELAIEELKRLRRLYGSERLRFNTIKIHFDGVHEIRTSAVLEAFAGDPHNRGGTLVSQERLARFMQELEREKMDLHLHVVGDRATRVALDAYESVRQPDWQYPRLTLCHLELVNDDDIARFKELGVVANFTPHWFGDLFQGGDETLGVRNNEKMRAKSFFEAGALVSFSSDVVAPTEMTRANPFLGMQVGINRQEPEGGPDARIMSPVQERLTLEQLLQGYTANAAHQLRLGDRMGSIAVGKQADLVIVEGDLITRDAYDIANTRVLKTMSNGVWVYQDNSAINQ